MKANKRDLLSPDMKVACVIFVNEPAPYLWIYTALSDYEMDTGKSLDTLLDWGIAECGYSEKYGKVFYISDAARSAVEHMTKEFWEPRINEIEHMIEDNIQVAEKHGFDKHSPDCISMACENFMLILEKRRLENKNTKRR